ncbi:MAG: 2-oxo acid dehydrogenase subunit E2 [Leptolyngbya sp. PLA3]|nr:MAG: 2-oxo acid dehydrogenase subunit E2 [Cyanobacteria bacterium CYA]MCE7968748.1 2-oxo acid dehydrogenase subunit E2 [Leptolyngbya sp. PL-A3]
MSHKAHPDPNVFILPDLGEGVHEAELISWKVKVGQHVEEHDIIAEMETDKALVEVPSPRSGVIRQLHGQEGQILNVGNPLVTYEPDGQAVHQPRADDALSDPHPVDNAVHDAGEDAGTVVGSMSGEMAGLKSREGKALAAPAVRRLARDMGIDLQSVEGSGIGGRITAKDVQQAAMRGGSSVESKPAPQPGVPAQPSGRVAAAAPVAMPTEVAPRAAPQPAQRVIIPQGEDSTRVPFRGVRRKIAERLRASVDTAVHFTVMDEADVTELDALRRQLGAASGERVSFLPFVCSAVARVLTGKFGALNATVDEEAGEIVQHRSVHMGIATDTESGLMVPVMRDCDRMGVLEISRQIGAIASASRDRSIDREQLMGSTFTISNVGSYAGRFATPVINAPEVGILAVGRTREGMVVRDGWFRVGKLMPLSLACDHRVVDGATAALCLAEIVDLLQHPSQLLTPARG